MLNQLTYRYFQNLKFDLCDLRCILWRIYEFTVDRWHLKYNEMGE